MASFVPTTILLLLLLFSATTVVVVVVRSSGYNGDYMFGYCSPYRFVYSTADLIEKERVVYEAMSGTYGGGHKKKQEKCAFSPSAAAGGGGYSFFCAYAFCRSSLSQNDCRDCLNDAAWQLEVRYCSDRAGGQLRLMDCFLRYETYQFCT
ncbi:unnamed protein product [Linum trigynum]|uniref:Gnk2-homologous domain-containing protein n=1 Tax=Linum trigynum TaxID=586398 RepID=A0AAV2GG29_9ROSI